MMLKTAVLLVLVSSTNACCGLAFTTCCQAYAPPRIIGYQRIPLYAKMPVQQAPPPPPPAYAVAPGAPVIPAPQMPVQEVPIPSQPIIMQQPPYFANPPQTIVVQEPRPVPQPVFIQETPAYAPPQQSFVVQEMPAVKVPLAPIAVAAPTGYAQPAVAVAQPAVAMTQPLGSSIVDNTVDFNSIAQVPTAKALKLRRAYLKQVKVQ